MVVCFACTGYFLIFDKTLPPTEVSFADRMKFASAKRLQLLWLYTFAGQTGQLQESPLELLGLARAAQFGRSWPVWPVEPIALAGADVFGAA